LAPEKERTLIPPQSGHIYLATGVPTRIDRDSERPREVKTAVCTHHWTNIGMPFRWRLQLHGNLLYGPTSCTGDSY